MALWDKLLRECLRKRALLNREFLGYSEDGANGKLFETDFPGRRIGAFCFFPLAFDDVIDGFGRGGGRGGGGPPARGVPGGFFLARGE